MNMRYTFIILAALFAVACSSPEPKSIAYGEDQCASCKMNIVDAKYGAEAVTNTGKTYVFDAPECMLGWYLAEETVTHKDVHSLWVTDYSNPGTLIDARKSFFFESDDLHSPMSMNVASFSSEADRDAVLLKYGGEVRSFEEVLGLAEDYR